MHPTSSICVLRNHINILCYSWHVNSRHTADFLCWKNSAMSGLGRGEDKPANSCPRPSQLLCGFCVSAPPQIPGLLRRPLKFPKMEPSLPLPPYSLKTSKPKSRVLIVFFSIVLFTALLGLLLLKFLKLQAKDFYSFEVKDAKGRPVSLEKYRGKVSGIFCL